MSISSFIDDLFGGGGGGGGGNDTIADILAQQEQYRFDQLGREHGAYKDYLGQYNSASAANSAAAAATANANAAGRAAEEGRRYKQSKKAHKKEMKNYKKILGIYEPFKDSAHQLLPQMQGAYEKGLGLAGDAMGQIGSAGAMAKLNTTGNANIALPKRLKGGQ